MDSTKYYNIIKDYLNRPKFKPIQIIFLVIGIVLAMFTYTDTFKNLDDWIKICVFATWSMFLLFSGVSIGSVKNLIEKGLQIFTDKSKTIEQKYDELFSAFLIVAAELGIVAGKLTDEQFKKYNKEKAAETKPKTD